MPGLPRLKSASRRSAGCRWRRSRDSGVSEANRSPATTAMARPSLARNRSDRRMPTARTPPSPPDPQPCTTFKRRTPADSARAISSRSRRRASSRVGRPCLSWMVRTRWRRRGMAGTRQFRHVERPFPPPRRAGEGLPPATAWSGLRRLTGQSPVPRTRARCRPAPARRRRRSSPRHLRR